MATMRSPLDKEEMATLAKHSMPALNIYTQFLFMSFWAYDARFLDAMVSRWIAVILIRDWHHLICNLEISNAASPARVIAKYRVSCIILPVKNTFSRFLIAWWLIYLYERRDLAKHFLKSSLW